jgi:hypothetical protein
MIQYDIGCHEKKLLKAHISQYQYITYGYVSGVIITGNEDGAYSL